MIAPDHRPAARRASVPLQVLADAETFCSWLFTKTARWPKRCRFTLSQRLEQLGLDLIERITVARYSRAQRRSLLRDADLRLERMRRLLRIAKAVQACDGKTFERAARAIDRIGRMLHGWRRHTEERADATRR